MTAGGPDRNINPSSVVYICRDRTRQLPLCIRDKVYICGFNDIGTLKIANFQEIWIALPVRNNRTRRDTTSFESALKKLLMRDKSYTANVVMLYPEKSSMMSWTNKICSNHYVASGCTFIRGHCRDVLVKSRFALPQLNNLKCTHAKPMVSKL